MPGETLLVRKICIEITGIGGLGSLTIKGKAVLDDYDARREPVLENRDDMRKALPICILP